MPLSANFFRISSRHSTNFCPPFFVRYYEICPPLTDFFMNSVNLIDVSWQCMPERFINFIVFPLRFEPMAIMRPSLATSVTTWVFRGGKRIVRTLRSPCVVFEIHRGHRNSGGRSTERFKPLHLTGSQPQALQQTLRFHRGVLK